MRNLSSLKRAVLTAVAGFVCLAGRAAIITVDVNTTWTAANQAMIDAADDILINAGVTLTLAPASGATLSITKPISGTGTVVTDGMGTTTLNADNSAFDGQFIFGGNGNVYLYGGSVLGSTVGSTTVYEYLYSGGVEYSGGTWNENGGVSLYLCGITTSEPIEIKSNDKSGRLIAQTGTANTLQGPVTTSGLQVSILVNPNATLTFENTLALASGATGSLRLSADTGAKIIFNQTCTVPLYNSSKFAGQVVFNAVGNAGGLIFVPVLCGVDWAFNGVAFSHSNANGPKLDLNGHPQRVSSFKSTIAAASVNPATQYVTSSAGRAFLYVDSATADTNRLTFAGTAGLFKEGTGVTTTFAVHSSVGNIAVTNGALVFAGETSWKGANEVTVAGQGTLTLADVKQIGLPNKLTLAESGVLNIPDNTTLTVDSLYVDGVRQNIGTYPASALNNHLGGENTSIRVACDASTQLITSNTTWTETDQATIDSYSSISVAEGVTLTLRPSANQKLILSKPIGGSGSLVKYGSGDLELRAANTFRGTFLIGGNGKVHAYDGNAFGSADAATRLYEYFYEDGVGNTGELGANLFLYNLATDEPFCVISNDKRCYLKAAEGTVTLNGAVALQGVQTTLVAEQNCRLVLNAGLFRNDTTIYTEARLCAGTDAEIVFNNVSNSVPLFNAVDTHMSGRLVFNAPGNSGGYCFLLMVCGCDYAFNGAAFNWDYSVNHGKMDLAGHDQRVKDLAWDNVDLNPVKFNGYITNSAGKAFLHVIDTTTNQKSLLPFRGSAGLSFDGTGKTTLYSVSSSTGDVQVTSGELAFATGASWLGADKVSVVGSGKLTLADVKQLGLAATLTLDGQGKLELPAGGVFVVSGCHVDGNRLNNGYYSAAALNNHLVDNGALIRVGKPSGLILSFR